MNWYIDVIKNHYFDFDGRARRQEFWMFTLFHVLATIVLAIVDNVAGLTFGEGTGILGLIYAVGVFLPSLGVTVRRLHDRGQSGWWVLAGIVPILNLALLIYMAFEGDHGANEYGEDPKGTKFAI